jgi:hypothetical protein
MTKSVYILICEKNRSFLGVFGTCDQAIAFGRRVQEPTFVLEKHVMFPSDFSKLDAAISDLRQLAQV